MTITSSRKTSATPRFRRGLAYAVACPACSRPVLQDQGVLRRERVIVDAVSLRCVGRRDGLASQQVDLLKNGLQVRGLNTESMRAAPATSAFEVTVVARVIDNMPLRYRSMNQLERNAMDQELFQIAGSATSRSGCAVAVGPLAASPHQAAIVQPHGLRGEALCEGNGSVSHVHQSIAMGGAR